MGLIKEKCGRCSNWIEAARKEVLPETKICSTCAKNIGGEMYEKPGALTQKFISAEQFNENIKDKEYNTIDTLREWATVTRMASYYNVQPNVFWKMLENIGLDSSSAIKNGFAQNYKKKNGDYCILWDRAKVTERMKKWNVKFK